MSSQRQLNLYDSPTRTVVAQRAARGSDRDELLTADDVASRLRMTRAWVYAETRADNIPHIRLGRYIRYRRAAIEAWILAMEDRAGASPRRD